MLVPIVVVLAAAILLLIVVVAMRPNELRVTRSASMSAPPSAIFPLINDLRAWDAWSPWAKMDPNAKNTFEGPPSGPGAKFHWAGNKNVGEGQMTILECRPNDYIKILLEFFKPMKGVNTVEFDFQPKGNQTLVTWTMFGPQGFMGKLFGLFMNMDKMLGGEFDKGLASIKGIVESPVR